MRKRKKDIKENMKRYSEEEEIKKDLKEFPLD